MAASLVATAIVSAVSVSGGHTRQAMPMSTASAAETHSDENRTQAAFCHPMRMGKR